MYGEKDTGWFLLAAWKRGTDMHDKRKALLHMAAVFAIFFITDSFCNEVIGLVFRKCNSVFFILLLYVGLDILNVWAAVFLYSKYVLKMSLPKIYLGMPFPDLRWCIAGIVVPFVADAVSLVFTKGEFQTGCHAQDGLAYLLLHEILSSGFRTAVTEEMLFRGLLLRVAQKGFGSKAGIFVSSFFYAAARLILYNGFAWAGADDYGMFLLTFLMGAAFALVTCETGSVWSSAAIHFLYNILSGNAYILHIDTKQDFPAIFAYTVESGGIFFMGIPIPSIAVFFVLIIMMLIRMKKENCSNVKFNEER